MKSAAHARKLIAVWVAAALFGAPMSCSVTPHADRAERTVAITFDDLPMVNPEQETQPLVVATQVNDRILASLRRYRAPATGFANEIRIRDIGPGAEQLLTGWNRGRFELGNHGASHADANALDLSMLEREIADGEATIGPLARSAGRTLRFFRFPYNHLGETAEKQAGALALLQAHGYDLAASTIDTSDYIFNRAFSKALQEGDLDTQARIKQAYLDYTATQIDFYAGLNQQVLGYEPPAIMLLHANRLNAETLDAQLALFRKAGYRFVSLAEAQSDPAYAEPPRLSTRFGPMWGYRWARDRGVPVNGSLEEAPPDWISAY